MTGTLDVTIDLLRQLIRNQCVNDGETGSESRNVYALTSVLEGPGIDLEVYEPAAGRASLVARIEGSDPTAPTLMLSGHTDVVPADPTGWHRDPFGGELVDGFVWGRGAIDMLDLTASMAVAMRSLADDGFRPRGTLVYAAVADEEAGSRIGARWLVGNQADAIRTDYVLTEFGGSRLGPDGLGISIGVAEKGPFWLTLRVGGTPGHASQPYASDNALITAARVVDRLGGYVPRATVTDAWDRYVEALALDADLSAALLDPARIDEAIERLAPESPALARHVHACTHTTIAPTMLDAGVKTNVIPDAATIAVDVRALPGQTADDVLALIDDALGELRDRVTIDFHQSHEASGSPADTPLWHALERSARQLRPGSSLVPSMMSGFTDSGAYRELGAVCYGCGLFSDRMPTEELPRMFHGRNERVDVESLQLMTDLWPLVVRDLLG